MPKTLTVETIQLADPNEPLQSLRFEFREAFANSHKVTAHVGPAKRQNEESIFDLLHGFVTTVAIDHQHALRIVGKVRLRHIVTATGIEHIDHRVFPGE